LPRGASKLIVVDASVWLDLFNVRDKACSKLAEDFFVEAEGLTIYEPMLFKVEIAGLLARRNPRHVVESLVEEIVGKIHLCRDLDREAYHVALSTGSRAADAYYIACARKTNSILVSNDRMQVRSARLYNVEAYYLLDEKEKVFQRLRKLKSMRQQ